MIQAETNLGVGTSTLRVSVLYTRSSHGYSYFSNFGWSFSFSPSSERNERYTDSYQRNSKNLRKNAIFGGAFILMCGVELVVRMKKKNRNTHIYEYANEKKKEGREKERKKREAWTACFFYDLLDYCYYYYHYFQVYAQ